MRDLTGLEIHLWGGDKPGPNGAQTLRARCIPVELDEFLDLIADRVTARLAPGALKPPGAGLARPPGEAPLEVVGGKVTADNLRPASWAPGETAGFDPFHVHPPSAAPKSEAEVSAHALERIGEDEKGRLVAENDRLRQVVRACAERFREYAEHHANRAGTLSADGDPASFESAIKAARNHSLAEVCEGVLAGTPMELGDLLAGVKRARAATADLPGEQLPDPVPATRLLATVPLYGPGGDLIGRIDKAAASVLFTGAGVGFSVGFTAGEGITEVSAVRPPSEYASAPLDIADPEGVAKAAEALAASEVLPIEPAPFTRATVAAVLDGMIRDVRVSAASTGNHGYRTAEKAFQEVREALLGERLP